MPTWVPGADGSGFGLENLALGVVRFEGGPPRPAVRVGELALDLAGPTEIFGDAEWLDALRGPDLNGLIALGPPAWTALRERLVALLDGDGDAQRPAVEAALRPLADCEALLPVAVADFVDGYASEAHATNAGRILRPGSDAPLPRNWHQVPIGYHGRAGGIVVSGTPVRRPTGQRPPGPAEAGPTHGPERRLDAELELGVLPGPGGEAFGFVLVNDWSAREVQRWESQPLGPYLGKAFATSMSAWVVPAAALAGRRVPGPPQNPLPYLRVHEPRALDVDLELVLVPPGDAGETVVTHTNARELHWSPEQQLRHAVAGGATLRAGDLFASGTISGPEPGERGCLLEATWDGREPIALAGGGERTYLEDGDTVILRGRAGRVAFGEVHGLVLPAG